MPQNLQFKVGLPPSDTSPVNLSFTPTNNVNVVTEYITLTPTQQVIRKDRGVNVVTRNLTITGNTQGIAYRRDISTTTEQISLVDSGNLVVFRQESRTVNMITRNVTLDAGPQGVVYRRDISTVVRNLQLVANDQTILRTRFVTSVVRNLTLTANDQVLFRNRGVNVTSPESVSLVPSSQTVIRRIERLVYTTTRALTINPNTFTLVKDRTVTSKLRYLTLRAINYKAAAAPEFLFILSGGTTNVLSSASLGGAASTNLAAIRLAKSVTLQSAAVPGVTVLGVHGGSVGTGTLSWSAAAQSLRWTGPNPFEDAGVKVITGGLFIIPVQDAHVYVNITYGSLSGSAASATYAVTDNKGALLDNVGSGERVLDHTNYRCLWLKNATASALTNVELDVSFPPQFGEVAITSEFATAGLSKQPTAQYAEHAALQRHGMQYLAARPAAVAADRIEYWRYGEFLAPSYHAGVTIQTSDGATTQLPAVLADETDSTNVLAGLDFSQTLFWPTIAAGGFVSFWVRRYIKTNSSGSDIENERYTLRVLYD